MTCIYIIRKLDLGKYDPHNKESLWKSFLGFRYYINNNTDIKIVHRHLQKFQTYDHCYLIKPWHFLKKSLLHVYLVNTKEIWWEICRDLIVQPDKVAKIKLKLKIKINANKIDEVCANVPDFLYYEGELNLAILQAFYFPSIENEIKQKISNGSIRPKQASNIFFERLRIILENLGITIADLRYNCFESNVPQNLEEELRKYFESIKKDITSVNFGKHETNKSNGITHNKDKKKKDINWKTIKKIGLIIGIFSGLVGIITGLIQIKHYNNKKSDIDRPPIEGNNTNKGSFKPPEVLVMVDPNITDAQKNAINYSMGKAYELITIYQNYQQAIMIYENILSKIRKFTNNNKCLSQIYLCLAIAHLGINDMENSLKFFNLCKENGGTRYLGNHPSFINLKKFLNGYNKISYH